MAGVLFVCAVGIGVVSGEVGAGMTVFGLASVSFSGVALWAGHSVVSHPIDHRTLRSVSGVSAAASPTVSVTNADCDEPG